MQPGQTIEAAIWLSGTETKKHRKKFESAVRANIAEMCSHHNVVYGPVVFTEKRIGEDRVPAPPDHIQGPGVRLLVAETQITGFVLPESGFTYELDRDDLMRLRGVIRNGYALSHNGARLTDMECDDMINEIGPEAALDELRRN